jgi:hypothetical protein
VRAPGWGSAKPAIEVTTDLGVTAALKKKPATAQTLSSCERYHEFIQESLNRGRNCYCVEISDTAKSGLI